MQSNYIREACSRLNQKLNKLSTEHSRCTIYRVYTHLRSINNKAYDPEVIAIGPYHRDKANLKIMEDHKLHCFHQLLQRKDEKVERYVLAIGPLEKDARKCYANPISLNATEFIEMLILDGCFIIEFLLGKLKEPIFNMDWIYNSLQRDLMLFENQIPFFVLCDLFDLIVGPNQRGHLMQLLTRLYSRYFPGIMCPNRSPHTIQHVLDLIYMNLVCSFNWPDLASGEVRFIRNATSLKEANVKFKKIEGVSLFDIRFEQGTLCLPPLTMEDSTESYLRNLIAYEQYFCKVQKRYVTDYVGFFDYLINSSRDVQFLSHAGIIQNCLGDDGVVADIFNKLSDSIVGEDFVYRTILDKVDKHCNKRTNRWISKLRRDYLSSPWAIISIIAAAVLLLLTVAQTVCSILQIV